MARFCSKLLPFRSRGASGRILGAKSRHSVLSAILLRADIGRIRLDILAGRKRLQAAGTISHPVAAVRENLRAEDLHESGFASTRIRGAPNGAELVLIDLGLCLGPQAAIDRGITLAEVATRTHTRGTAMVAKFAGHRKIGPKQLGR